MGIKLDDYIAKLSPTGIDMRGLMGSYSRKVKELIQQGFEKESDPYGNKWAAWKGDYQSKTGKILDNTNNMKNSFTVNTRGHSMLYIRNSMPYSGYHQHGTKKMVARLIMPKDGGPLPDNWKEELDNLVFIKIQEYFGE